MDTAEDTSGQHDTAPGSFGNLPTEFLQDVQTALEDVGYDLTSADAMQMLAGDPSLVEQLLPVLAAWGSACIGDRTAEAVAAGHSGAAGNGEKDEGQEAAACLAVCCVWALRVPCGAVH